MQIQELLQGCSQNENSVHMGTRIVTKPLVIKRFLSFRTSHKDPECAPHSGLEHFDQKSSLFHLGSGNFIFLGDTYAAKLLEIEK